MKRFTSRLSARRTGFAIGGLALLFIIGCAQPADDTAGTADTARTASVKVEEIPITTSSEAARKLFDEGQHLLDVGRGVKAREKFQAAIAEDPGFARAHYNQSNSALSFKEFQECLDTAAEHLEGVSDGERLMVEINRTFLTNDTDQGVALATELVEKYPNSPRAKLVLAGMMGVQNDNEGARASFEAALALEPKAPGALFGLANNYLFGEPKDFVKAESWARKMIDAYPDEAKGYESLGDIKRAQNDLEGALAAYSQATEADPNLELAQHKKGHVNSFLGNIADARASYDAAIDLAPPESKAGYAVYRAFTHIHAGDVAAAVDELEGLVDDVEAMGTPADQVKGFQVFALTSAANAALHAGFLDKAAAIVEQRNGLQMAIAEEVGTEDGKRLQEANCHVWEGLVAAYQGNADAAAEHAEKISMLVEGDENPRKMEPVHWVLGMSALVAGDAAKATEHLRQANHANNMYIRYQLARAEAEAGNAEEAKKLFNEVASFNFNSIGFALVGRDAKERAGG
ncbi:MAG: tetratricopeptide repeat protein [bacterium]|nr:tetratricopeptide repeat protein [bacterium]